MRTKYIVLDIINLNPVGTGIFTAFNIKKDSIMLIENTSLFRLLFKVSIISEFDYISFMIRKKDAKHILVKEYEH